MRRSHLAAPGELDDGRGGVGIRELVVVFAGSIRQTFARDEPHFQ